MSWTGDQVGYLFGDKVGPSLFHRPESRLFKPSHVDKAQHFFDKHGAKTIVLARFVPIVRTFAPIVAGVGSMRYRTFVVYNVLGGLLWAVGITTLGYFLGEVSWIELRLSPEGDGRTRFHLTHIAHVDDERWAQFGPGAVGIGWDLAFVGLALHLASGEAVDPAEVGAWSASDEGRRFMTESGQAWGEAHVVSGLDPEDAARASAARTIAFYTATPDDGDGEGEG